MEKYTVKITDEALADMGLSIHECCFYNFC